MRRHLQILIIFVILATSLLHTHSDESEAAKQFFDAVFYAELYPDVVAVYGESESRLLEHYLEYGRYEGRSASAFFNIMIYRALYDDLYNAFGDDLDAYANHYREYGINEGRVAVCENPPPFQPFKELLEHEIEVYEAIEYEQRETKTDILLVDVDGTELYLMEVYYQSDEHVYLKEKHVYDVSGNLISVFHYNKHGFLEYGEDKNHAVSQAVEYETSDNITSEEHVHETPDEYVYVTPEEHIHETPEEYVYETSEEHADAASVEHVYDEAGRRVLTTVFDEQGEVDHLLVYMYTYYGKVRPTNKSEMRVTSSRAETYTHGLLTGYTLGIHDHAGNVYEYEYRIDENNTAIPSGYSRTEYDEEGRKTGFYLYDANWTLVQESRYSYDRFGFSVKNEFVSYKYVVTAKNVIRHSYNNSGGLSMTEIHEYDEDGRLAVYHYTGDLNYRIEYQYDGWGNLIYEFTYLDRDDSLIKRVENHYDQYGNKTAIYVYDSEVNKVILNRYATVPVIVNTEEVTRKRADNLELVSKKSVNYSSDGAVTGFGVFTYDDEGSLIENRYSVDDEGNEDYIGSFQHEYDDDGRQTLFYAFDSDGTLYYRQYIEYDGFGFAFHRIILYHATQGDETFSTYDDIDFSFGYEIEDFKVVRNKYDGAFFKHFETREFDENGNVSFYFTSEDYTTIEYIYDERGTLRHEYRYFAESDEFLSSTIKIDYDVFGNILAVYHYGDGVLLKYTLFENSYQKVF